MEIVNFKNPDDSKRHEAVYAANRIIPECDKFILISSTDKKIGCVQNGFTKYDLIAVLEIIKSGLVNGDHDCE